MTTPEDALEEARNALERMRAEGAYAPDLSRAQDREPRPVAIRKLLEWALIEPDTSGVRSTRAPAGSSRPARSARSARTGIQGAAAGSVDSIPSVVMVCSP